MSVGVGWKITEAGALGATAIGPAQVQTGLRVVSSAALCFWHDVFQADFKRAEAIQWLSDLVPKRTQQAKHVFAVTSPVLE